MSHQSIFTVPESAICRTAGATLLLSAQYTESMRAETDTSQNHMQLRSSPHAVLLSVCLSQAAFAQR
jgi:hypothetical protein